MTATLTPRAPAPAPPPTPAKPGARKRRRWHRLVIPFVVVFLILIGTGIVHAIRSVDVTDAAYLSPSSGASIGGQRLADLLTGQGVTIDRETKSSDALVRAYRGDVTLFVPAPSLMHPYYLRMLKLLPADVRVVLVSPSGLTLTNGRIPIYAAGSRWTTKVVAPGCDLPEARKAGPAETYHTRYQLDDFATAACYSGSLVASRYAAAEVIAVGASEPFRNDRIGAYGNAALATGLLSAHHTVVWLDLHRGEPMPGLVQQTPDPGGNPAAPPSLGTGGSPDPDFPVPSKPVRPQRPSSGGGEDTQPPPIWLLLPPWVWATLGLLGLAALAFALARARRLGPPVSEPLPVAVRAAETVEGRGRLYRRAKARDVAVDTLRTGALQRIRPALGLPPDADRPTVVAAALARTGRPDWPVEDILYGAQPNDDAELVRLVTDLDTLVHALTAIPEAPGPILGAASVPEGEPR